MLDQGAREHPLSDTTHDISGDAIIDSSWRPDRGADQSIDLPPPDLGPPPAWVFILAGQSNMLGLGRLYPWIESSNFGAPPSNVEFYAMGSRLFGYAGQHDRNGDGEDDFGPEVTLIAELAARYPAQKMIVFKYAIGGTSLGQWLPRYKQNDGSFVDNPTSRYDSLQTALAQVVGSRKVSYRAVFWMQGESDCIDEAYHLFGKQHRYNLEQLITRFRQDLSAPSLPFIFGRIHAFDVRHNGSVSAASQIDAVRAAQDQVAAADSNAHVISTDGFILRDVWHFNGSGQFALGKCYAEVYQHRQSSYDCPLVSGYDQAPLLIYSSVLDGPPAQVFTFGQPIYARAIRAGSVGNNIAACREDYSDLNRCENPANWTTQAPWSYDAIAQVWRNTPDATRPSQRYRGYWSFLSPSRRGFPTAFTILQ